MNDIVHGDSYELIKTLDADSVDLLCTDPPYGIEFMGKHWDRAVPPASFWADCLRVLKPGAFAFVMSLPRQDCLARMIVNLEDAGFVVAFTPIYWTFATGFPKAANVSKLIDKQAGAEREIIGEYTHPDGKPRNWLSHTTEGRTYQGIRSKNGGNERYTTLAATPQAQALNGSYAGFQPKPAVEVILVAMKPLAEDTYVAQALANGKGVTWLDDGRIPLQGIEDHATPGCKNSPYMQMQAGVNQRQAERAKNNENPRYSLQGRFPANLLVADDVLNDGHIRTSGDKRPYHHDSKDEDGHVIANVYGKYKRLTFDIDGDAGSYSRYFDLDAWFAARVKLLPPAVQQTFPWLLVPKPSKREKTANGQLDNTHPTVKPLKLFAYLLTLGSRPGDLVLDPFGGSGTTAVACQLWQRRCLAIERELEYVEFAQARRAAAACQPELLTA